MKNGSFENKITIRNFEEMPVWQDSIKLSVIIYKTTDHYPKSELFGITSQLRRASSSIAANIAEGFGRKSIKEKINYYRIAYGSLLECKNFLYLSLKLNFINEIKFKGLVDDIELLQGQFKAIISKIEDSK